MNLVIALLSTRGYLTAERIRANVAGYAECRTDEAFSRMFERDKNELRDLGIPLETGRASSFDPIEGYRIKRDAYALPDIDLTPDEAEQWYAASDAYGLDRIFLVAPSSTPQRLARTVEASRGFVYAASTMGVTGAREAVSQAAPELVGRVNAISDIPVGVGLGVRSREQAAELAEFADGVIVGSALVSALGDGVAAVRTLTGELAAGVREKAPAT
jgi:hypothetical protein